MSSGSCKYCGKPIFWSKQDDKWIPFEDSALTRKHDCPNRPTEKPKPAPEKPPASRIAPLTEDEILFIRNLRATLKMMKT